jgi:hypothetical protein
MLNLLWSNTLGWVYPGIQVGIGSARNYPLLMTGGVLRFVGSSNMSLSVGASFPWYQELKTLKLGDPVAGTADIEKDLRFHLAGPSLYVGLQRSF